MRAAHELPLVDDLGSGALVEVEGEPTPAAALAAGADLVCFSGDKLLGGPQAGIVAGRADLVERLRRHPLQRALRADKLTLAALEGTLALYLDRPERDAGAADAARAGRGGARPRRAAGRGRGGAVEETVARVGGGALPLAELPSFACAVEEELAAALRGSEPPVVGVVRDGRMLLDCRTLTDAEAERSRRRFAHAADGRHRRPHRPRQDVARPGPDRQGHRPAARGATSAGSRSTSATRRSSCRTAAASRSSTCPGHERFVRNMVAGATGIDLFLLVIDAGEGARPQTHEHLAILPLLGIEHGVVAVTKADAVDAETLELALDEARELVPGAEVVAVSAKTGAGLDELRAALGRAADRAQEHNRDAAARLYVDRVFSLRGIGTVVTGTLWSGSIGDGDELRVEPGGRDVRVRSVQVHDRPVERAEAGQRVAVALARRRARRARAAATRSSRPARSRSSYRLDVALEELEPIADGRGHVHHGTAAVPAGSCARGERLRAAAARRARRRRARRPRRAARRDDRRRRHASSTPLRRRHADPERFERAARGEATVHAPVLVDGAWQLLASWLEELRAELERGLDGGRPARSGRDAPAEPWAAEVLPLLPSSGAARGSTARAAARASATRRGRGRRRRGRARGRGARAGEGRRRRARPLPRAEGPAGPPRRRLGGLRRPPTSGRGRSSCEECESAGRITLARFRDLPASAAATPSSCSSASTPTE